MVVTITHNVQHIVCVCGCVYIQYVVLVLSVNHAYGENQHNIPHPQNPKEYYIYYSILVNFLNVFLHTVCTLCVI